MDSSDGRFARAGPFAGSIKLELEHCRESNAELTSRVIGDVIRLGEPSNRLGLATRELEDTYENDREEGCVSPTTSVQQNVDVFGNRHPAVALDLIDCFHCGRSVAAGRFAPHLHKCMGKGRQASRQASQAWLSTLRQKRKGKEGSSAVKGDVARRKRVVPDARRMPSSAKRKLSQEPSVHTKKGRRAKVTSTKPSDRIPGRSVEMAQAEDIPAPTHQQMPDKQLPSFRGCSGATCASEAPGGAHRDAPRRFDQHAQTAQADMDCPAGRTRSKEVQETGVDGQERHVGLRIASSRTTPVMERTAALPEVPNPVKTSNDTRCTMDDILSGKLQADICFIKGEASSPPLSDTSTMTAESSRSSPSPRSRDEHRFKTYIMEDAHAPGRNDDGLLLLDCIPMSRSCLPATVPTRKRCGRMTAPCAPAFLPTIKAKH